MELGTTMHSFGSNLHSWEFWKELIGNLPLLQGQNKNCATME